jgi:coenzyme F420 biosynthesis associated uncharacterized protein
MGSIPELVDWGIATKVGRAVAGPGPALAPSVRAGVASDLAELTSLSDELVRRFTGLAPPDPPGEPVVLDRAGWIDANIDGFRALLAPLAERAGRAAGIGRRMGSLVLGVQLGLLLGYLSQKVLGQYDLLLAAESGGRVYFVAPNVVGTERRWRVPPRDFRLWIALHEVTHRTQFAGVPWLRDHVKALIGGYLQSIQLDARALRDAVARVRKLLAQGPRALRGASVLTLFLSPEQRDIVSRMQALMTVVEGHGNFVMNRVGSERIASFETMKRSLGAQRAQTGAVERALQRAIGIDLKYQQYALGESFFEDVEGKAGMDGVNAVWVSPENLPDLEEIRDTAAWLRRVSP